MLVTNTETAMVSKRSLVLLVLVLLLLMEFLSPVDARVEFQYKRYTYRKKRDDKKYRTAKQRCEMSSECQGIFGVDHTKCVRICISETCYNELYGEDPLEEGEIDVRLNSFKGCLSQVAVVDFWWMASYLLQWSVFWSIQVCLSQLLSQSVLKNICVVDAASITQKCFIICKIHFILYLVVLSWDQDRVHTWCCTIPVLVLVLLQPVFTRIILHLRGTEPDKYHINSNCVNWGKILAHSSFSIIFIHNLAVQL